MLIEKMDGLALALLMAWVLADNAHDTFAADNAAKFAKRFHRRTDSHRIGIRWGISQREAGSRKSYHTERAVQLTISSFSQLEMLNMY
jgi:hypothetical protein